VDDVASRVKPPPPGVAVPDLALPAAAVVLMAVVAAGLTWSRRRRARSR
jgi:hypothetical protein